MDHLTNAQRAFLVFHAEAPFPHAWAWRQRDGASALGPPSTWQKLRAWKQGSAPGWRRQCTITRDDLHRLHPYFGNGFEVNAAGRIALGLPPAPQPAHTPPLTSSGAV